MSFCVLLVLLVRLQLMNMSLCMCIIHKYTNTEVTFWKTDNGLTYLCVNLTKCIQ